jgi:hypothetical protein
MQLKLVETQRCAPNLVTKRRGPQTEKFVANEWNRVADLTYSEVKWIITKRLV